MQLGKRRSTMGMPTVFLILATQRVARSSSQYLALSYLLQDLLGRTSFRLSKDSLLTTDKLRATMARYRVMLSNNLLIPSNQVRKALAH